MYSFSSQFLVFIAGIAVLCHGSVIGAQTGSMPLVSVGNIRLVLLANDSSDQKLTVRFINDGQDSVSFPHPTMFCGESRDGFVMISSKVLNPKNQLKGGMGCVVDKVGRGDILSETSGWITIPPGGSYDIVEPLQTAVNTNQGTKFQLVATYRPAYVNPDDQRTLEEIGIHLLQAVLVSEPLVLEVRSAD